MCQDDYVPLGAIVLSPWQAKVNANSLFLPGLCYNILVISHAYNRGYGTGYAITLYGIHII